MNTSGGTSPLSYSWSNTLTTQTISSLPGGTYTVTITDANQCTITGMAHFERPSSLVVTTNVVSPISCYSGTNGSIEAIVQSGTSPHILMEWGTCLEYFIDFGLNFKYLYCHSHRRELCTATSVLTLGQPSELIASSTATPILCYGGNSNLTVSAIGGIQPYVGTGTSVVSAGSYSSTVTDNNGCTSSTSISIVEPQPLTLTVSQSVHCLVMAVYSSSRSSCSRWNNTLYLCMVAIRWNREQCYWSFTEDLYYDSFRCKSMRSLYRINNNRRGSKLFVI